MLFPVPHENAMCGVNKPAELLPSQQSPGAMRVFKEKWKLPGGFCCVVLLVAEAWRYKKNCHALCFTMKLWTFVSSALFELVLLPTVVSTGNAPCQGVTLWFWKLSYQGVSVAVLVGPISSEQITFLLLLGFLNLWTKMNICNGIWHLNFYLISHRFHRDADLCFI